MAATQEDVDALLRTASAEWNKAEEVVKSAEQICGEAIVPSIKELRYAGRRLVDAFGEGATKDLDVISGLLKDAIFNCHCARHDAIDVATAVIASNLNLVVKKVGYEHILKAYPDFAKLRKELSQIMAKIRVSRGNRNQRDEVYASIHQVDLPAIAMSYEDFLAAEDIMRSLAQKQRRDDATKTGIAVASVVIAAGGLLWGIFKKSPPNYVYLPVAAVSNLPPGAVATPYKAPPTQQIPRHP